MEKRGGKRSGAGRKPTNKTKVCLALKQDTAEAISTLSEKLGIDKSSVVDNAVREYENKMK